MTENDELLAMPIETAIRLPGELWERYAELKNARWRELHPEYVWGVAEQPLNW